jgi:hypothetical protein
VDEAESVGTVIFAVIGAGVAAGLGVVAGWIGRPAWAIGHPWRVVALLAGLALVGAFLGLGADYFVAKESLPRVEQRSDGSGCPPYATADAQTVAVERTAPPEYPVALGETVAFKLIYAEKMQLEMGGALIGNIPEGQHLAMLSWGDPGTVDVAGNYGNGVYYRLSSLRTTGNCWIRPQGKIAYSGAEGITFRHWLVLVGEDRYAEFTGDQYESGYNDVTLDSFGVVRLGYFDIRTAR